jgi:hypothetical protein
LGESHPTICKKNITVLGKYEEDSPFTTNSYFLFLDTNEMIKVRTVSETSDFDGMLWCSFEVNKTYEVWINKNGDIEGIVGGCGGTSANCCRCCP